MDDEHAYMELILGNQQDGMSPLEIGIHALGMEKGNKWTGGNFKEYATAINKDPGNLTRYKHAAEVYQIVSLQFDRSIFLDKALHLATIHKAPPPAWPSLVSELIAQSWSVKETEKQISFLNSIIASIPEWYPIDVEDLTKIALTDDKLAKQIQNAMKEATKVLEALGTSEKKPDFSNHVTNF